jgi:hypothetical protein
VGTDFRVIVVVDDSANLGVWRILAKPLATKYGVLLADPLTITIIAASTFNSS